RFPVRSRNNIVGSDIRDERDLTLLRVQGSDQLSRQVLLPTKNTQALAGARQDLCWIGSQERGCHGQDLVAGYREVQRKMMSFHTPAPGSAPWLPKHGNVIKLGVAMRRSFFEFVQDFLETHDRCGLHVASLAQPAVEQGMRQQALRGSHLLNRKTLARLGNEMPIVTLVVPELEKGLGFLVGRERCQKILRRVRHLPSGRTGEGGD